MQKLRRLKTYNKIYNKIDNIIHTIIDTTINTIKNFNLQSQNVFQRIISQRLNETTLPSRTAFGIFVVTSICFLIVFSASSELLARAGGAGGGGSSSGGGGGSGDGIGYLIYIIFRIIPFPYNVGVAGVVGYGYFRMQRTNSVLNDIPEEVIEESESKTKGMKKFLKENVDFDRDQFCNNVAKNFVDVQNGWSAGDIGPVRRFLSDGVYQRFNTQMEMMKLLKQKNTIKEIILNRVAIDRFERRGKFDVAHVAIQATISESFTSELDASLNSEFTETFIEYWSFIRKRGIVSKNILSSPECPNCGAQLPKDLGEISKCTYCETLTNTGEYDWVLSEITQADDYALERIKANDESSLINTIENMYDKESNFSIQEVEDKASNGYLQILTALATRNPARMRRFLADGIYETLSNQISDKTIAFNRLYLNSVQAIAAKSTGDTNTLLVRIKSTFQRISIDAGKTELLDAAMLTKTEIVLLQKDKQADESKGSVYAHACPSCGASVADTTDIKCPYCSSVLNSTNKDWVITEIMDAAEYETYYESNKSEFEKKSTVHNLDKNVKIRDYALNNIMVIIAADGKFEQSELDYANKIAKGWGYAPKKITGLMQLAKTGKLAIKMPDDKNSALKIITKMEAAAKSDQDYSAKEKAIIETIKSQYANN